MWAPCRTKNKTCKKADELLKSQRHPHLLPCRLCFSRQRLGKENLNTNRRLQSGASSTTSPRFLYMSTSRQEYSRNSVNGSDNTARAALGRRSPEVSSFVIQQNPLNYSRQLNVATWNVRTMNQVGSMEQIKREAIRLEIDVLGVAETRWTNNGKLVTSDGWEFYYSGGDTHQAGVGLWVSPKFKKAVTEVRPINDRLITMRINAKPQPINIIQVYMPTSTSEVDDVVKVYAKMQNIIECSPSNEKLIIMGDLNAKIGEDTEHPA